MAKYLFKKGQWENDFEYAYSLVAKSTTKFVQEDDCVTNTFNDQINDYNYVSVVYKQKQHSGVKITAVCSFEHFGAPLITLANSLEKDEQGNTLYGEHYEVVLYEKGCNIWHIVRAPEGYHKKYVNTKTDFMEFDIADGEQINVAVVVDGSKLHIEMNGKAMETEVPLLNNEFFVGVTACEGINHFYSVEIE